MCISSWCFGAAYFDGSNTRGWASSLPKTDMFGIADWARALISSPQTTPFTLAQFESAMDKWVRAKAIA
jgi:hypothetical protein